MLLGSVDDPPSCGSHVKMGDGGWPLGCKWCLTWQYW